MTQTKIVQAAQDEIPNDNLSLPLGTIRTVRHFLEFTGVLKYIRSLKTKGVRLDLLVVQMCVFLMGGSNSLNACADWLRDPRKRKALGFREKDDVGQKTLNRGLEILGRHRDGIIIALWEGLKRRFDIDDYDVNIDGSAVVLYGPKSEYGAKGYGRDKNRGKMQVEFMVAQLASMGIPVYIKPYAGNVSDEEQYRDCIPEIAGLLQSGDTHQI